LNAERTLTLSELTGESRPIYTDGKGEMTVGYGTTPTSAQETAFTVSDLNKAQVVLNSRQLGKGVTNIFADEFEFYDPSLKSRANTSSWI